MRAQSPFKPSAGAPGPRDVVRAVDELVSVSPNGKGKGKAVFIDILLEGVEAETNFEVPEGTRFAAAKDFLAGLGEVVPAASSSRVAETGPAIPARSETNAVALHNILNELLTTERSYVKRIRTLHSAYTVPLKTSAKSIGRNPMGLTAYEANSLFSNIEKILALNESFLSDFEAALLRRDSSWADVLLQHLSGFEAYNVYVTNYPTAKEIERKLATNSTFQRFCENVQYSPTADVGNTGLRDLLAEPFQRIARYPMMLTEMLRQLSPKDPVRPTLLRASAAAANIALNVHDEVATRTAEVVALASSIANFPRPLISGHHRFITVIDVKDVPSGQSSALHASLFLFSDMLVIAKRPSGERGRVLAGLERPSTMLGSLSPLKGLSGGLQFKGAVQLCDMTAIDDGASMALHFELPPLDVGSRWSNRPTRRFFAESLDKRSFLAQLWKAQAQLHVQPGVSTVLSTTVARLAHFANLPFGTEDAHVFFTIYNRNAYMGNLVRGHTVLRLDVTGLAHDPLAFPPDMLKPQLIIEADPGGPDQWTLRSRRRGEAERHQVSLSCRAMAYAVVQTVLQAGMCEMPPRYNYNARAAVHCQPVSPRKQHRLQPDTNKMSSPCEEKTLRESDASVAFGSNSSLVSETRQSSAECLVPAALDGSPTEDNLAADEGHAISQQSHPVLTNAEEDVFGLVSPLSPRARTPMGPRPSPGQAKREVVPADKTDTSTTLQKMVTEDQRNAVAPDDTRAIENKTVVENVPVTAPLKRHREESDIPASPNSTHLRKKSSHSQRASGATDYSPGIRSPLGRHPPRRVPSEHDAPAGDILRDIGMAIDDAAGRSESMADLRKMVNTFVLPETPNTALARSGASLHRRDSIPRSPKLDSLVFASGEKARVVPAYEAFKAEVNDKLDALLGGWEQTTKQYRLLAKSHRVDKSTLSNTVSAQGARIKELEGEVRDLGILHSQLNEEIQEIYHAVNRELDRMFEELRSDPGMGGLQRELQRKTANEVLLQYRIRELEAQLAAFS